MNRRKFLQVTGLAALVGAVGVGGGEVVEAAEDVVVNRDADWLELVNRGIISKETAREKLTHGVSHNGWVDAPRYPSVSFGVHPSEWVDVSDVWSVREGKVITKKLIVTGYEDDGTPIVELVA